MMIPQKIHYFWFGHSPKSSLIIKCIESWKKFFPDFEIIEWNESNYDVNKNQYLREAYAHKKWAFVSDYARLDVLYHEGGIYFDTDVEVIRPFPLALYQAEGFTGVESTNLINPGLVFGCVPGLPILKDILDDYNSSSFISDGVDGVITINMRVTDWFERNGFQRNGRFQHIAGVDIYPADYFCGYDQEVDEWYKTDNTLSIHHYTGSWKNKNIYSYLKYKVFRNLLKFMLGTERYRKILRTLKNKR